MKKIKVCAATPNITVANPKANAKEIIRISKNAGKKGAKLIVFPELSLTGCTCGDLFFQDTLLASAMENLEVIAEKTKDVKAAIVFGLPVEINEMIYNGAAVLYKGKLYALVTKRYLHSSSYGYEDQWFDFELGKKINSISYLPKKIKNKSGRRLVNNIGKINFDIGEDIKIDLKRQLGFTLGIGIGNNGDGRFFECAYKGEEVDLVAHLGARKKVVDRDTSKIIRNIAYDSNAPIVYAEAGDGESTTDYVFAGESEIASEYTQYKKSVAFRNQVIYADVDIDEKKNAKERNKYGILIPVADEKTSNHKESKDSYNLFYDWVVQTQKDNPFIPESETKRIEMCETILKIQAKALAKRMKTIGTDKLVLGISGGLDSTLALIACVNACDELRINHKNIIAITMPGFGTTSRTHNNASKLMRFYGVSKREVDITESVKQHFKDIKHNMRNKNSTYENAQARMRTMILMDVANDNNALVVGTGDFSELALGWCTYNGDHMSMYSVNANIPKTVIREVVSYEADRIKNERLSKILKDIVETPVSPELLPNKKDKIAQKTENIVGPYELHDYFLYIFMHVGLDVEALVKNAINDFEGKYDEKIIKHWLKVFIKRFFSQQFKRNCSPDGPQIFSFGFSPRGGFSMPSDASAKVWLDYLK